MSFIIRELGLSGDKVDKQQDGLHYDQDAVRSPDYPPKRLGSEVNRFLEDDLQSKADDNSHNHEEIRKHSEACHDLLWTQVVDVDRNDSHIIADKYSLEDSAHKEDVDVGDLKDPFDNQCQQIDEEDELPASGQKYFLVKSFMIEEEMRAPMMAPAGTEPWSRP